MELFMGISRFVFLLMLILFLLEVLRIQNRNMDAGKKAHKVTHHRDFFLTVVSAGENRECQGRVFKIKNRFSVGRDESNDFSFHDPFLSGSHLLFEKEGDACYITDLNSRNGTIVEGEQLPPGKPTLLKSSCTISVGQLVMTLTDDSEGSS